VKGEGSDEPYRAKIRRVRGEQARARWDLLVGAAEAVVVGGLVVAACVGAVAGRSLPDEPHPASRSAAIRVVAASLTAASPPYSMTLVMGNRSEPQPGDRQPAPGNLSLVQSFVNSRWDLERDLEDKFADCDGLANWLVEQDLVPSGTRLSEADLGRALDARDGLQALLFANNGVDLEIEAVERMDRALRGPGPVVQLSADSPPDFVPWRRDLDGALALIGTIAAIAQLDDSWLRLKACPGEDCGWAFYDHSRNQAGTWCSMSICGSRAKARDYRRRKRRSHP
jgi:predicted RNA-binding Zn ribbon-like protein